MPDRVERVTLFTNGAKWEAWTEIKLHLPLDSFSTVSFASTFEPERREMRAAFRPFSYQRLDVVLEDEVLFAGTQIDVSPATDPVSRSITASGYALPGVLADVSMPASAFPLEFNGLTLRQIAERVCEPFGLEVVVDDPDGAPFRRVAMKPEDRPYAFLTDLAKQRALVISNTAEGKVRFFKSATAGRPVQSFREGEAPLGSVSPSFSPQNYFSEITGLASTRVGRRGSSYTAQNTFLSGVLRPSSFTIGDTDPPDLPAATRARLGRMFGNMVSYEIGPLPTWRDPSGALWRPNTFISLYAPGAMVYEPTDMLVREVTLTQTPKETTATLSVVLPGAFSGELPTRLPWDE